MKEKIMRLLERFPERSDAIEVLSETNERFRDLLADHHETSEELGKMETTEKASDVANRERLQRRRADLEEELLLLMEQHQRI